MRIVITKIQETVLDEPVSVSDCQQFLFEVILAIADNPHKDSRLFGGSVEFGGAIIEYEVIR